MFSHLIDDVCDNKDSLNTDDLLNLSSACNSFNRYSGLTGPLFDEGLDDYKRSERTSEQNNLLQSCITVLSGRYHDMYSRRLSDDINMLTKDMPTGLYNMEAFQVGLLKIMIAGFIQNSQDTNQRQIFLDTYNRLCNNFIGDPDSLSSIKSNVVKVSWGSGVQSMFASLGEVMDHPSYPAMIDNFDILLAPLVYLTNNHEEDTGVDWKGEIANLEGDFIQSMRLAVAKLQTLMDTTPALKYLYVQKIVQLVGGSLQILEIDRKHNYPINSEEFKKLRNFYRRELPLLLGKYIL